MPPIGERNRHLPRASECSHGKAQVSFKSANGEDFVSRGKLSPPPGEDTASTDIGTISGKNCCNNNSEDLTNSDGNHRLSSRIRRSLQVGRRSQRYPNKFLVNSNSSISKVQLPKNVHKTFLDTKKNESSLFVSKQDSQMSGTTSTQSTQLLSSGSNRQQTSHLSSSGSSSQRSTNLLLSSGANDKSPRRPLPMPKGLQSI